MKCLLILLLWTILTNYVTAQNCLPDGVSEGMYVGPLIPDEAVGELARLEVPGITDLLVTSVIQYIQVDGPFDEEVVFSLTEAFKDFERNTPSGSTTSGSLAVTVELICGGVRSSMTFLIEVYDINNHPPDFGLDSYTYGLPMPFPSGLEITQWGIEITATDLDFRNSGMDFSIDTELFSISYAGTTDALNKVHRATIRSEQPLEFTETHEFTITATDRGNPTFSETTKLIIEIDSVNSVPSIPMFVEPYIEEDYEHLVSAKEIELEVLNAGDSSECSLEGDIKDNFSCDIVNDKVIVTLESELPPDDVDLGGYRILVATVTKSPTRIARTVIILDIPEPIITTTACPTETTEITTVCECPTTTETIPCSTTPEITTTMCPETTTMSCEPCDTTVGCSSLEDTTPCICPETTTVTACAPCTTTPSIEECSCEPCECPDPDSTTGSTDVTSPSTDSPGTCSDPTPCDCSSIEPPDDSTVVPDCSTTPFVCPVTECTTIPSDCSTTPFVCPETECTTVSSGTECPETTTCDCPETTTDSAFSPGTACPETTTCDCPETTTDSAFSPDTDCPLTCPETTESTTIVTGSPDVGVTDPSSESSTQSPGSCDCPLCSTTPADCAVTPQDCSECGLEICNKTTTESPTWECSDCTAEICEDYVPCDECPESCNSTTSPITASVSFSRDSYEFILAYNEVISTVEWPVSATSTIEEDITYEANGLPGQLDLDPASGMVTNNEFLSAGIYEFTITATGRQSDASATASVTITIRSFEICSDGVRAAYSLLVKEVIENHPNTLLTTALQDEEDEVSYQLTIESISPTPNADLFSVSEDEQTLSCSALDRESNDFADMEVTQYTIVVIVTQIDAEFTTAEEYRNKVLHISSELSSGKKRSTRADSSQCVLINDIPNDAKRTTIVVVVGDENDNPPEFAVTSMIVGYPASSLLSVIAPAYLVQVEATDADIGINAELVYFVDTSYVTIHPDTGVVYPTESILAEDFTFTVTARDEKGEGMVSSNSLQVQVKLLQQEHISIIKLRNALLEDLSTKIFELNAITNVNIRQLQASVLPSESTRQLRADESYYLYITAYALDNSNNLVTTEQLQELLDDVEGLSVTSLRDFAVDDDSNSTGLIAAVCILSVILFLVLLGFFAFYFFKLRKSKPYTTMEEQISDSSTPTQFKKNMATGRSSSKLSQLGHESDKPERRPTGILIGTTVGDSDDSPPESPPKERRKSVVFNNNVEQINIVREEDGVENSKL